MTYAETRSVGRRQRPLRVVSDDDVRRIHEATLDVLSTTGCTYYSQRALDVLAANGATVDRETTVAKLPPELVERAVATIPRRLTLGARDPFYDLPIDGEHAYLTVDGCAVSVREAGGAVRRSTRDDVFRAARLAHGLDGFGATAAIVSAQDKPEQSRVLHELDACLRGSSKHAVVVSVHDEDEARWLIRMGEAVAGGSRELRERPLFTCILCTVSPLHQERFGMDLAFTLAEAGIPFMLYPMPILGATAPVTPAGTAVVNNAEIVAAVVAVQLAFPGAPIIHAGGPTALDMRTGSYFAAGPEPMLLRCIQAQMAAFYGLPAGLGYGGTKAKEPDAQAAWENTLTMLTEFLAGADFIFGSGLLDGSQIFAPELLVIDDEVFGMVTHLLRGVTVDDESLTVDLIKGMGFEGRYLRERQTRAGARDLWRARLGETRSYEAWRAAGAPSTAARARARVDEILAAPAVPFPDDLGRELDSIISAAEATAR
ncbi:MAG TPA: trimethylamine methyltransferase family protein [Thermoleophilia bacterium]|nr:trimethylamine methyltransferase family protein [Thermoleophilia bacterium]